MKKITIAYWVFTSLFLLLTIFDAALDLMSHEQATATFNKMQMPLYLLPFYGMVKALAAIIILVPGYPRVKDWAYAILIFNATEAAYAMIATGEPVSQWGFMAIPILLGLSSYLLLRKKYTVKA